MTYPAALHEASIDQLGELLRSGEVTCLELVRSCLERIEALDRRGPELRAVIDINPRAEDIAMEMDIKRQSRVRGPLHGIPILLKDNIDTVAMPATAGSLALVNKTVSRDAPVAWKLIEAGGIPLGTANMSEWANFRSEHSSSGWSARGGQARNPYVLDRSPCGSSSGSASAVAAAYVPVSLGTETDGSILCPGAFCSVVGLKPTVGLTSRRGVIPISHSQDTVGPFARSVADAATVLTVIAGPDPLDDASRILHGAPALDYRRYLDPDGLRGARIGVPRTRYYGYNAAVDAATEKAIEVMREAGAEIIDPADIPTAEEMATGGVELEILLYEFKADITAYLSTLADDFPLKTLADLIAFNRDHAAEELALFGQDIFEAAEAKGPLTDSAYRSALETSRRVSRRDGIDAVMDRYQLDALVAPSSGPPWRIQVDEQSQEGGSSTQPAAMAGYPAITVPAGYDGELPLGVTFFGRALSEGTLIRCAYAFEQATGVRRAPRFVPSLPPL